MTYTVRVLPNKMVLVIDQETRERKIMKPRELQEFFTETLDNETKVWDNKEESILDIQDELSKL